VRPILIDESVIESIRLNLPEFPEKKASRFVKDYGLGKEIADALVRSGYDDEFELLSKGFKNPQVVARVYLNTYPELEKVGLDPAKLSIDVMKDVMECLAKDMFAKEAIPEILTSVLKNGHDVASAIQMLGMERIDLTEVRDLCARIVKEREGLIKERGENALGPIMGIAMKELRGKVDGKILSEILGELIRQRL